MMGKLYLYGQYSTAINMMGKLYLYGQYITAINMMGKLYCCKTTVSSDGCNKFLPPIKNTMFNI